MLAGLLALAGCHSSDPCSGISGTCIGLRVEGPANVRVDRLDITTGGATQSSTRKAAGLPVQLALVLPAGTSGAVDVAVSGYLAGEPMGSGTTTVSVAAGAHGSGTVVLSGGPGTSDDLGDGDLGMTSFDLTGGCTPSTTFCSNGSTLQTCSSDGTMVTPTSCPLGCSDTPPAHCKSFVPSLPALASDLQAGLADTVLTTGTTYLINTDDGSISNIRGAGAGILTQISYRATTPGTNDPGAGVFGFNSLDLQNGATLQAVGSRALVIVAATTIGITGVLDARAYNAASTGSKLCNLAGVPGAGGFAGATSTSTKGSGPGGGGGGTATGGNGGGAGGGHGAVGGYGGTGSSAGDNAGVGGIIDFPTPLVPLRGGSGGGAGTGGSGYSFGGGGGGAVQLVAGTSVTIGGGASAGGIDVGGCGGGYGIMLSSGGGGGAGGAILIEAPAVNVLDQAVLAANGGGGGSYDNSAPTGGTGFAGDLNATAAAGGAGSSGYTKAGSGAAGNIVSGGQGLYVSGSSGGGGGGAVGIILINNVSGSLTPAGGAIVSPTLNAQNSATPPQTVSGVGTITVQ
jgi:hypothetical protein